MIYIEIRCSNQPTDGKSLISPFVHFLKKLKMVPSDINRGILIAHKLDPKHLRHARHSHLGCQHRRQGSAHTDPSGQEALVDCVNSSNSQVVASAYGRTATMKEVLGSLAAALRNSEDF